MVLDTCAVLWLAFNREKFSEGTLGQIDRCEQLYISTMSFWEIGIKIQKKKLVIPMALDEFVRLYSVNEAVSLVAPDLEIILLTQGLPWAHGDPVDRIVVATAMKYDTQLVTGDSEIGKYYSRSVL